MWIPTLFKNKHCYYNHVFKRLMLFTVTFNKVKYIDDCEAHSDKAFTRHFRNMFMVPAVSGKQQITFLAF